MLLGTTSPNTKKFQVHTDIKKLNEKHFIIQLFLLSR